MRYLRIADATGPAGLAADDARKTKPS